MGEICPWSFGRNSSIAHFFPLNNKIIWRKFCIKTDISDFKRIYLAGDVYLKSCIREIWIFNFPVINAY